MGLRKTNGISIENFNKRFGKEINLVYGAILKKYIDNGMMLKKGDRLCLSERGIELSNSIMCDFILK
jgi:oxygen-independent coproporphyrinogen-3 oxidase